MRRPVLIVEGQGDTEAVPRLLRDFCHAHGIYDFNPQPRPLRNVEIRKLARAGELERYVDYALRQEGDGDSVLLVLDCEDFDPDEIRNQFLCRINAREPQKPVEVVLLKAEFESLFLPCLPLIAERYPDYGWDQSKLEIRGNCERFRNAKGVISDAMNMRAYKETRDQVKFLSAIDYSILRQRSASFCRFEEIIARFVGLT